MKSDFSDWKKIQRPYMRPAALIVIGYIVIAGLWIVGSDTVVEWIVSSPKMLSTVQTYKGLGFVLTTGGILFVLLIYEFRRIWSTEEKLRQSQHRERLAVEAANVGLWDWDLASQKVYYSPEWINQLGYTGNEISDDVDEWQNRIHPEDKTRILRAIEDYVNDPASRYEQEFRMQHKDGTYRWFLMRADLVYNSKGKPISIAGSHIDITERKRNQEALSQSRRNFMTFCDTIDELLFVTDEHNQLIYVNETLTSQLGYRDEEILGQDFVILHPPKQRETAKINFEKLLLNEISHYAIPLQTKDGREIPTITKVTRGEWNGQAALFGNSRDITERKQMEAQRLELALEKQRTELLKELIGNLSHDLKNPLATIDFSLVMLEKSITSDAQQNELETIRRQSERLTKLIQDILALSRLDHLPSLEQKLVDLNQVLDKVQKSLQPSIRQKKQNLTITNNVKQLPPIMGDETELERAFVNLVDNAVHYTPDGGSIVIKTKAIDGKCVLEIVDTGMGIPHEDLPKIFDRFYRSPNSRRAQKSGTGLGLAIVKRVVEMHHGSIEVKSKIGKGSTFRVELPALQSATV